jgi:HAD superfamily hydrolase (TIGR01490 family)
MTSRLPPLAVFDLDRTLVPFDSEASWLEFLIGRGVVDAVEAGARSRALTDSYNRGEAGPIELTEYYLAFMRGASIADFERLRDAWVAEVVRLAIAPQARALVERHRAAGHLGVITTATFRFLASAEAAEFGPFDVIATDEVRKDGRFTGRVQGIANAREGKVERLRTWLEARDLRLDAIPDVFVYADSLNDLPLLSHATHPVAVNPDPGLEAYARRMGWATMEIPGYR